MIKKLAYDDRESKVSGVKVSSEFLRPYIEKMKITKYGKEAIIVARGQKLWFVHSLKLSSTTIMIKDPFQVQEYFICFKTDVNSIKIPENQEEREIEVFSHFYQPVQVKLRVEVDVSNCIYANKMHV